MSMTIYELLMLPWGCSTATRGASARGADEMKTLELVERGVERTDEAMETATRDHWRREDMMVVGKEFAAVRATHK